MKLIYTTIITLLSLAFYSGEALAQDSIPANKKTDVQPKAVHPSIGESVSFGDGCSIRLAGKIQNYGAPNRDADILSPKSVNIHPSGKKFYVNSLEGGKTAVYSLPDLKKLAVISHRFDASHSHLWAPPSGLFKFRHYHNNVNNFLGKPVESAFSHDGRYLWVPYYRRSFDLNAQDPSALAVIDAAADTIVRIMEAGVLPKMITVSPDGATVAIAHWGDNTVGLIDSSSENPKEWKYIDNIAVGHQLFHDFSLTESVDRDKNSGEALRGSVFTPDGRYLLVGCMSGGGIAVIDVKERKYLGKLFGMMANVRHLVIKGDYIYASINVAGYVQRLPLAKLLDTIAGMDGSRNATVNGWESTKVQPGARTLELSPMGDYIFVACNFGSAICIVDSTMHKIAEIPADSYPVGLDISPDGRWLISTSQGRKGSGGNCVDIFELTGLEAPTPALEPQEELSEDTEAATPAASEDQTSESTQTSTTKWLIAAGIFAILLLLALIIYRRKK